MTRGWRTLAAVMLLVAAAQPQSASALPSWRPATFIRASATEAQERSSILRLPRHGLHGAAGGSQRLRHLVVSAGKGTAQPADAAVVRANYSDGSFQPSGFGQLRVWSNPELPRPTQHYAAGFAEGFLTAARAADQLANLKAWLAGRTNETAALEAWLLAQDAWSRQEARRRLGGAAPAQGAARPRNSPFWEGVDDLAHQLDGLLDGYNAAAAAGELPGMLRADVLLLNAIGDLLDLIPALNLRATGRPGPHPADAVAGGPAAALALGPAALRAALADRGHCSALIRLAGDLSDIFMGHVSWFSYSFMIRIFKFYDLNARRASFSSYPGMMSSLDDFYVMPAPSQRLVMLQTTNSVLNPDLFKRITEDSLLAWQRVRLANALATSGKEWVDVVGRHNSGTYNNQYMVIDLKKFAPGKAVEPGLLWVAEQIPGRVRSEDLTRLLELGYFSSYNVPFFRDVYDESGYADLAAAAAARGRDYEEAVEGASYQLAARAQIFRRDAGGAHDLAGLKRVLRSNGFKEGDPYAKGRPGNAICARNDLDPEKPRATGCTDGKVTSYTAALQGAAWAVNGPTAEQGLPPFAWRPGQPFARAPHRGHPQVFDYAWQHLRP